MAQNSAPTGNLDAVIADPAFWVMACLIAFAGILIRLGIPKQIISSLDDRQKQINADLEQARNLREEAQELLARAERDQIKAEQLVEQILQSAHADTRRITETARRELAETLSRRRAQAEQNIANAERQAQQRLTRQLTDLSCQAALVAATNIADDAKLEQDFANACALLADQKIQNSQPEPQHK